MRNQIILLSLLASLTASGCQALECAEGTIERDGRCEADNGSTGSAMCGPFTELVGDRCVPIFPPTVCEEGSESDLDPDTGVTTCKGGGIPACGAGSIGCSKPSGSKQTFCGQLYDFETNALISDPDGTPGTECDPASPTASGACALQLVAYDAIRFAGNPTGEPPLPVGEIYLDNCGRFRLKDVETNGTGPFIGIGVDDVGPIGSPTGTATVTVAIAAPKQAATATNDLEHWIVKPTTVGKWVSMNGPAFSMTAGIYAPVFRSHKLGNGDKFANQAGVTITKNGNPIMANDFYFMQNQVTRESFDTAANATGVNGTVFVNNASVNDMLAWNGTGGLGQGCRWEPHAGASLPGIVFIQVFRKIDIVGMTCND